MITGKWKWSMQRGAVRWTASVVSLTYFRLRVCRLACQQSEAHLALKVLRLRREALLGADEYPSQNKPALSWRARHSVFLSRRRESPPSNQSRVLLSSSLRPSMEHSHMGMDQINRVCVCVKNHLRHGHLVPTSCQPEERVSGMACHCNGAEVPVTTFSKALCKPEVCLWWG